jgi:hypothetical protein
MTENWLLFAAVVAWLLVTLTRLALAHRRAQRAADRKTYTGGATPHA